MTLCIDVYSFLGFMAYLSLLSLIHTHDHPVVKVFVKVLTDGVNRSRLSQGEPVFLLLQQDCNCLDDCRGNYFRFGQGDFNLWVGEWKMYK